MRRLAGFFKVLGTLVCVGGAMVISLYKGKAIHMWSFHFDVLDDARVRAAVHDYARGTAFLVASCLCYAFWFILQVNKSKALTVSRVYISLALGILNSSSYFLLLAQLYSTS